MRASKQIEKRARERESVVIGRPPAHYVLPDVFIGGALCKVRSVVWVALIKKLRAARMMMNVESIAPLNVKP